MKKMVRNRAAGPQLRDYLELMRLPNVFTSMADVAMGFLFVRELATAIDAWLLAVLLGASSLLYLAGVVLNDVFDLELDSRERPDRPLPSGRDFAERGPVVRLGSVDCRGRIGLGGGVYNRRHTAGRDNRHTGYGHLDLRRRIEIHRDWPGADGRLPHVQRAFGHERGRVAFCGRTLGRGRRYWSLYCRNHLVCQDRKHPQLQAALGAFHNCDDVGRLPY